MFLGVENSAWKLDFGVVFVYNIYNKVTTTRNNCRV